MQCYQQPVSQDLLAWVLWEFQHVDTAERSKKGGTWSAQWNPVVMAIYLASGEVLSYLSKRKAGSDVNYLLHIPACRDLSLCSNECMTIPLPSANSTEETHCPLVLSNSC